MSARSVPLSWLAEHLGMILGEELPGGGHTLAGAPPADGPLGEGLVARLGLEADRDRVEEAIAAAREGGRASTRLSRGGLFPEGARLIAADAGQGRVRVAVLPLQALAALPASEASGGGPSRVCEGSQGPTTGEAAHVTHEVANALTAIAGWALLGQRSGPLSERAQKALDVIERSAKEALSLTRRFLRQMRQTPNALDLPSATPAFGVATFDLCMVVEESLETLAPLARQEGALIERSLDRGIFVLGAPEDARSIITNLVKNAIEALELGGSVRVSLRALPGSAELVVEDDGPGLEGGRELLETGRTSKPGGAGLGLTIVRESSERLGGRLRIEPGNGHGHGRGVRASLTLPRAELERAAPDQSETRAVELALPYRLLVIDDDDALREMLEAALSRRGARVHALAGLLTGPDGALPSGPAYDLAIVDLKLGEGRGDALLARLKDEGRAARTLLMTGGPVPASASRFDAVLRKPFELPDLLALLRELLREEAAEGSETGS